MGRNQKRRALAAHREHVRSQRERDALERIGFDQECRASDAFEHYRKARMRAAGIRVL